MRNLAILIPAAGSSSRMRGTDKLLEPLYGGTMLARQAAVALACADTIVTLRDPDPLRRAALRGIPVAILAIPDASEGMSASLRTVSHWQTPLMILPADMPDITTDDLYLLIAAFDQTPDLILRGSALDKPGHPVILPAHLIPELADLQGDEGARSILRRHADKIRLIALPDQNALTDLDSPEDWAAWRAKHQGA